MHTPPDIDADITKAHTLPSWCYRDAAFHAQMIERVFTRSWQLIGDTDLVPTPGTVHPFSLLEGCLDEPCLLTRDADGSLHCVSNVCTHRGNLLAQEPGHCTGLRCRYHGRRFTLDGSFVSMGEFEAACDFPTGKDNLPCLPLDTWQQFLFVSLDPARELTDWLAPVMERADFLPWKEARFDPDHSRNYTIHANWMLYCDNYLEGFHIPFVHPDLSSALDYGAYSTDCFDGCILQTGIARGEESTFTLPHGHPDTGKRIAAWYFWCFPNLMINIYPWGVSMNIVTPCDVGLTRIAFLRWAWDPALVDSSAGAALDRVEQEDEEIVEAVQRGMQSRLYDRGRFSPSREQGVHHFHRLVAAAAGEDTESLPK